MKKIGLAFVLFFIQSKLEFLQNEVVGWIIVCVVGALLVSLFFGKIDEKGVF